MTSVALTTAVTESPFFSPRSSALRRVITDSMRLPIGATLDASTGVLVWMPSVGFYSKYDLVFVRWNGARPSAHQEVPVTLTLTGPPASAGRRSSTCPHRARASGQPCSWAAGQPISTPKEILASRRSDVRSCPIDANGHAPDPIFFGPTVYGDRFANSGYGITANRLPPGTDDIAVFAYSSVVNNFTPAQVVCITVR